MEFRKSPPKVTRKAHGANLVLGPRRLVPSPLAG